VNSIAVTQQQLAVKFRRTRGSVTDGTARGRLTPGEIPGDVSAIAEGAASVGSGSALPFDRPSNLLPLELMYERPEQRTGQFLPGQRRKKVHVDGNRQTNEHAALD
jgi:hypothetical protein